MTLQSSQKTPRKSAPSGRRLPHLVPYQGSKRKLSAAILREVKGRRFARTFEPFAGSAAWTIAAADAKIATRFVIADVLSPLTELWSLCLDAPGQLADRYEKIWTAQLSDPRAHYAAVRAAYNQHPEPVALLYLLARCVKNAPRFSQAGDFNQSADHRRRGRRPQQVAASAIAIQSLLGGRTEVRSGDFEVTLADATADDLVYLDPPWAGTTEGKDKRYVTGLSSDRLIAALHHLNERSVPWLLSYDGRTGKKSFGQPLPPSLGARLVELDAGRSAQSTLSGRAETTVESLYVGPWVAQK